MQHRVLFVGFPQPLSRSETDPGEGFIVCQRILIHMHSKYVCVYTLQFQCSCAYKVIGGFARMPVTMAAAIAFVTSAAFAAHVRVRLHGQNAPQHSMANPVTREARVPFSEGLGVKKVQGRLVASLFPKTFPPVIPLLTRAPSMCQNTPVELLPAGREPGKHHRRPVSCRLPGSHVLPQHQSSQDKYDSGKWRRDGQEWKEGEGRDGDDAKGVRWMS